MYKRNKNRLANKKSEVYCKLEVKIRGMTVPVYLTESFVGLRELGDLRVGLLQLDLQLLRLVLPLLRLLPPGSKFEIENNVISRNLQ